MAATGGAAGEKTASSLLLGVRGYTSTLKNASTASCRLSAGHPIEVTLWEASPPALSHFSVHCPDLPSFNGNLLGAPKAIAAAVDDADGQLLLLLRVPIDQLGAPHNNDYLVYHPDPPSPKLDLLPNPPPPTLGDHQLAILSCGDDRYVVAALHVWSEFTSTLRLYRSSCSSGSWTSEEVSVEEPVRDRLCPIPDSAKRQLYHVTTKTITLGGAKGTVGWVDLWRGILLCDVLDEMSPRKLRDMPLPWPAKGNWRMYLNGDVSFCRDIAISQHKDSIKYLEMEIVSPRTVTTTIPTSTSADPTSYLEWVRRSREPQPTRRRSVFHPGSWRITTWSMPIPVTSWDDWRRDCTAESREVHLDTNPSHHYELLHSLMLSNSGDEHREEAQGQGATSSLSLGRLRLCYPALSCIDDDVVYLLGNAAGRGAKTGGMMVAVDVRNKELRGVAKLDPEKNTLYSMRCYLATGISKRLNTTTDTRVGRPEEDAEAAE